MPGSDERIDDFAVLSPVSPWKYYLQALEWNIEVDPCGHLICFSLTMNRSIVSTTFDAFLSNRHTNRNILPPLITRSRMNKRLR